MYLFMYTYEQSESMLSPGLGCLAGVRGKVGVSEVYLYNLISWNAAIVRVQTVLIFQLM
jgi:hypothetical protein